VGRLRRVLDRHRPAFVLAALLLVATLLPRGPFGIRARMAGVLSPLAFLGGDPVAPAVAPGQPTNVREEADSLLAKVHALETENRSLREFRSLKLEERQRRIRVVAANVVGRDPAWPMRRSVVLDRGRSDGLRPGLPVVVGQCLAGFVAEAGQGGCLVQLLDDPAPRADDPKVRLGVQVFRPGAANSFEGALFGGKRGVLWVDMLPGGATAKGDLVVTSSADPEVPPGLLVGTVVAVEENRRLKQEKAEVRPSADLAGLRSVIVLVLPEPDTRFSRGGAR
jgi:rod shape-determining protein MreC